MSLLHSSTGTRVVRAPMVSKKTTNWADISDNDSDGEDMLDFLGKKPTPVKSAVVDQKAAVAPAVAESTRAAVVTTTSATSTPAPVTPSISFRRDAPLPSKKVAAAPLPSVSSWGELTASFGSKTASITRSTTVAPAAPVVAPGIVDDDDDDTDESDPVSALPPSMPAGTTAGVSFDPELDSSRDGLPLMFKGLSKASSSATPTAASTDSAVCLMDEEEQSKSRQGTKRKQEAAEETSSATETNTTPVDMTAVVAALKPTTTATAVASAAAPAPAPAKLAWGGAGLKKPTDVAPIVAAAAAAATATPSSPTAASSASVTPSTAPAHTPLVKRQRRNDGKAGGAPHMTKPSHTSFLGAVTGVDAKPSVASASRTRASASVSAAQAAPAAAAVVPTSTETASPASAPSSATKPAAPAPASPSTLARQRAMRQKQVAIGKSTVGYLNYIKLVPVSSRLPTHPRTPDVNKSCSKRSMDGQLRQWRRMLHEFDPEVIAARANGTYVEPKREAAEEEADAGRMEDDEQTAGEGSAAALQ